VAQEKPVAVLFLDEIDGLLPRRTESSSAVDNRLVTQFLADVGGFKDSPNMLLILGATNKPWEIDEAVFRTGRFDEKLYIGVPDTAARLGMLRRAFKGVSLDNGLDLADWAGKLDMYSGSDVVGLAKKACQIAFRRSIDTDAAPVVASSDLEQAKLVIPSSITPAMLRQFEVFNASRFACRSLR
jgi:SpoVK/Ycf46/Vps4 family AAA+-type ATPase